MFKSLKISSKLRCPEQDRESLASCASASAPLNNAVIVSRRRNVNLFCWRCCDNASVIAEYSAGYLIAPVHNYALPASLNAARWRPFRLCRFVSEIVVPWKSFLISNSLSRACLTIPVVSGRKSQVPNGFVPWCSATSREPSFFLDVNCQTDVEHLCGCRRDGFAVNNRATVV